MTLEMTLDPHPHHIHTYSSHITHLTVSFYMLFHSWGGGGLNGRRLVWHQLLTTEVNQRLLRLLTSRGRYMGTPDPEQSIKLHVCASTQRRVGPPCVSTRGRCLITEEHTQTLLRRTRTSKLFSTKNVKTQICLHIKDKT